MEIPKWIILKTEYSTVIFDNFLFHLLYYVLLCSFFCSKIVKVTLPLLLINYRYLHVCSHSNSLVMKSRMKFLIFTVRSYEFTTFSRTEECYLISSFAFTSSRNMVMFLLERNICAIERIWQIFKMQKGKILKSLVDKVSSNTKDQNLKKPSTWLIHFNWTRQSNRSQVHKSAIGARLSKNRSLSRFSWLVRRIPIEPYKTLNAPRVFERSINVVWPRLTTFYPVKSR